MMLRRGSRAAIGLDIGGTKVEAALVDDSGDLVQRVRIPHSTGDVIDACVSAVATLKAEGADSGVAIVGVAIAGLIDRERAEVLDSVLLNMQAVPLRDVLGARLGIPLIIENDANAALAGVLQAAPPEDSDVTILVALGTGIGGAIAVGQRILAGSHGFAGELGHIPVRSSSEGCPCGGWGCLELVASGPSTARRAGVADGEELLARADCGDPRALAALADAGAAVGEALAGLVSALDPRRIYISGGFGHAASPWLLSAITHVLREHRSFASSKPAPAVAVDPVGISAAAIGVAHLAQERAGALDHPLKGTP